MASKYLQKAKVVGATASNQLKKSTSNAIKFKKYPNEYMEISKMEDIEINQNELHDSSVESYDDEVKKKDKFKSIRNNLESFAKNAAEKTAESTKIVASATMSVSKKAAERAAEGTKIVAQKAAEGTKLAVSVTVDATYKAADITKNAGVAVAEKAYEMGITPNKKKNMASTENISPIMNIPKIEDVENPAMFGIPLESTIMGEDGYIFADIPLVIKETIQYILDVEAYLEEGIFRLSTNMQDMASIKRKYDLGEKVDYSLSLDPHLPACTLKLFLRELPESIFTNQLISQFHEIPHMLEQYKIPKLKELINILPPLNSKILQEIYSLLMIVDNNSNINRMNITNLGIIFIPAFRIYSTELFEIIYKNRDILWSGPTVVSQHPKYPFSPTCLSKSNTSSDSLPELPIIGNSPFFPTNEAPIPPMSRSSEDLFSPFPRSNTIPHPPPRNSSLVNLLRQSPSEGKIPKYPSSRPLPLPQRGISSPSFPTPFKPPLYETENENEQTYMY